MSILYVYDIRYRRRVQQLLAHMRQFHEEPTRLTNKPLADYLKVQRRDVFEHVVAKGLTTPARWGFYFQVKVSVFCCLGVDLRRLKPLIQHRGPAPVVGVSRWIKIARRKLQFDIEVGNITESENARQVAELNGILRYFISEKGWPQKKQFLSVGEYVVDCLKVGDVEPMECTGFESQSPRHVDTVRGVLSYITAPVVHLNTNVIQPTARIKGCRSTYYAPEVLPAAFIALIEDFVSNEIPEWVQKIYTRKHPERLSPEALIDRISGDFKWYDHFPISIRGTDPYCGHELITRTSNSGPRRLHLSVAINEPRYNTHFRAHIQDCYGYSYSITPLSWMGCRSMGDYPLVAEIGRQAWLAVRAHLDPVSQQCPPTACNVLHYFGAFNAAIRPHQDNCPNMSLPDYKWNSQLLGSSVLVVNLFDQQTLKLTSVKTKQEVGCFYPEHMSIYVLSAFDDLWCKHNATYAETPGTNAEKVRISLVYRWLGRRTTAFCGDYQGERRWVEYHPHPNKIVHQKFKKCTAAQEGFRHGTGRWKRFKTSS